MLFGFSVLKENQKRRLLVEFLLNSYLVKEVINKLKLQNI